MEKRDSPQQHLTSPYYMYQEDDMLSFIHLEPDSIPGNGPTTDTSDCFQQQSMELNQAQHYYPLERPSRPAIDTDTPNIDIDANYLSAPALGGSPHYRSHPTSPSIASSRGSSPYPPSPGSPYSLHPHSPSLSSYSQQHSPLLNMASVNLSSSSSFENLQDSLSPYPRISGFSPDSELFGTSFDKNCSTFYDISSNPSPSPILSSSSSLSLPTLQTLAPNQPMRRDTLVNEAFNTMEAITKEIGVNRNGVPPSIRGDLRQRVLETLTHKLPRYSSDIDAAASRNIGTLANREASQRRKKKKGCGFFCFLCKEGRDFTTKDNFLTHIRVHFGAKLSECSGCGHEFPNKTVPKRHRTTCEQNRSAYGARQ